MVYIRHAPLLNILLLIAVYRYICMFCFFFTHFYFSASGQAVVTGVVPSPPRFLPSIFVAHRVQQSHCSSIFHRVLLTHALLALSASQYVHEKKSPRIYTSMHLGGFGLTKLTYTRLEDNLIRHRGDRYNWYQIPTLPEAPLGPKIIPGTLVGGGEYKIQYFGQGCMAFTHGVYLVCNFFRHQQMVRN